jgi:hypothetical protein
MHRRPVEPGENTADQSASAPSMISASSICRAAASNVAAVRLRDQERSGSLPVCLAARLGRLNRAGRTSKIAGIARVPCAPDNRQIIARSKTTCCTKACYKRIRLRAHYKFASVSANVGPCNCFPP